VLKKIENTRDTNAFLTGIEIQRLPAYRVAENIAFSEHFPSVGLSSIILENVILNFFKKSIVN